MYLKMLEAKPETIELFDEIGKLHFIGIRILKGIFNKRGQCKNHADSQSSPLFETPYGIVLEDFLIAEPCYEIKEFEEQIQVRYTKAVKAIDGALNSSSTTTGESSDYLKVRVFLDVSETNISQVSKRIGVDRKYIRRFHQEGQEFLKQKIND